MPQGHYFTPDPSVGSRPSEVTLALPEGTVSLTVDRGVFSGSRIDPGTLALLRAGSGVEIPDLGPGVPQLLDLGCGYGPIAVSLARRHPEAVVWAVDVNRRALALTQGNAAALGLDNVRVAEPDQVPPQVRFAQVWSNPPIKVGKEATRSMLANWLGRISPGGDAWLVIHKNLGGDSLARWLGSIGWTCAKVASKQGYRILRASDARADTGQVSEAPAAGNRTEEDPTKGQGQEQ